MNLHEGDVYRPVCTSCPPVTGGEGNWRGLPKKREDLARLERDVHNKQNHDGELVAEVVQVEDRDA